MNHDQIGEIPIKSNDDKAVFIISSIAIFIIGMLLITLDTLCRIWILLRNDGTTWDGQGLYIGLSIIACSILIFTSSLICKD